MKYTVIALHDDTHVGDKNQALGVQAALAELLKNKGQQVQCETLLESDYAPQEEKESKHEKTIVIASGDHGLEKIDQLKANNPNLFTVWSGHHLFNEFTHLKHWPNLIGLPQSVINEPFEKLAKGPVVALSGVPHTVTEQTVAEKAKTFSHKLPKITDEPSIVAIMLAGDAPDENGKLHFFTTEDAKKQANLILNQLKEQKQLNKDTLFLVTNGPRTGKHDQQTGEELDPTPHRTGETDLISQAFIDALQQGLNALGLDKEQVHFYDFQFADLKKDGGSAYNPMLHLVAQHKGIFFFPSESTSMITESEYVVRHGGQVIVYRPSSECPAHEKHLMSCFEFGLVQILENDGTLNTPSTPISKASLSAAETLAETAYQHLARQHATKHLSKAGLMSHQSAQPVETPSGRPLTP